MANGRMAAIKPAANTDTVLYTAPSSLLSTLTVAICNQAASDDSVRVAVCSGGIGTLAATDYIEYDVPVSNTLERNGIVIFNGESVVVRSKNGTSSFVAYGVEA